MDSKAEKIGIRRMRVVQDILEDAEGRTFLFEVNNVRMFIGGTSGAREEVYEPLTGPVGSNWIPADSFLTK